MIRKAIVIAALVISGIGAGAVTASSAGAATNKPPYHCFQLHYGAAVSPKGQIYALTECDAPHSPFGGLVDPTGDCLQVGSHRAGPFVDDGCVYSNGRKTLVKTKPVVPLPGQWFRGGYEVDGSWTYSPASSTKQLLGG